MQNREDVIDKIRKLLAHSVENGATQAEAIAFALKAQALIAEHDVQEWELGDAGEVIVEHWVDLPTRRKWRWYLASIVSDNFRCRTYEQTFGRRRGHRGVPHVFFVGYEQDARAAALVFERLYVIGDELGRRAKREAGGWTYAYDNFVEGFCDGVAGELERQCRALMLVVPQEVSRYYDELDLCDGRPPRTFVFDPEIHDRGKAAGREAVRCGRMEGDEEHLLGAG